jgi:thiamine transport system ATP-binding protein
MLTLETVRYEQDEFVLSADWRLAPEARVAVIGPSGAGKSTLLSLIGGFITPQSGRLLWDGQDITENAPSARPVASLFQEGNLFPHLSVYENAALGVNVSLRLSAAEKARVLGALDRVGLAGFGRASLRSFRAGRRVVRRWRELFAKTSRCFYWMSLLQLLALRCAMKCLIWLVKLQESTGGLS